MCYDPLKFILRSLICLAWGCIHDRRFLASRTCTPRRFSHAFIPYLASSSVIFDASRGSLIFRAAPALLFLPPPSRCVTAFLHCRFFQFSPTLASPLPRPSFSLRARAAPRTRSSCHFVAALALLPAVLRAAPRRSFFHPPARPPISFFALPSVPRFCPNAFLASLRRPSVSFGSLRFPRFFRLPHQLIATTPSLAHCPTVLSSHTRSP